MVLLVLRCFNIRPVQDLGESHEYGYFRVKKSYKNKYFRVKKPHKYGYTKTE